MSWSSISLNPFLHSHWNDPGVFVHTWLQPPLFVLHSSTSMARGMNFEVCQNFALKTVTRFSFYKKVVDKKVYIKWPKIKNILIYNIHYHKKHFCIRNIISSNFLLMYLKRKLLLQEQIRFCTKLTKLHAVSTMGRPPAWFIVSQFLLISRIYYPNPYKSMWYFSKWPQTGMRVISGSAVFRGFYFRSKKN